MSAEQPNVAQIRERRARLAEIDAELSRLIKTMPDDSLKSYKAVDVFTRPLHDEQHRLQYEGFNDVQALLDALTAVEAERDAAVAQLQQVTDVAVLALHDVWANSGRDGYNPWYMTYAMTAHENIAKAMGTDKWSLLYEAMDRKVQADDTPAATS